MNKKPKTKSSSQDHVRHADLPMKRLLSDPVVFADVVNFTLYGGADVVKSENLQSRSTEKVMVEFKDSKQKETHKFRDILKEVVIKDDGKICYLLIGVENQLGVCDFMIARAMVYDGLDYMAMTSDATMITLTIVISYSPIEWNAECTLHGFLRKRGVSERMIRMVPNYFYHILDLSSIDKQKRELMKSTIKGVTTFVRMAKDGILFKDYLNSEDYNEMSQAGKDSIWAIRETHMDKFKQFENECRKEGRLEGRAEGNREATQRNIESIMSNFNLSRDKAMDSLNIPASERYQYK